MGEEKRWGIIAKLLERIFYEALLLDPSTCAKTRALTNTHIRINISDWHLSLIVSLTDTYPQVNVQSIDHTQIPECDITLSGASKQFLQLANKKTYSLSNSGVNISGNVGLLSSLQSITENIELDWQDGLAQKIEWLLHDTSYTSLIGAPINSIIQTIINTSTHKIKNLSKNLEEYLIYESDLTFTESEFSEHAYQIRTLRQSVDRLEAKINMLFHSRSSTSKK